MTHYLDDIDVTTLSGDALEIQPQTRDWSEGYPEVWEYIEAPSCPDCDDYAKWIDGDGIRAIRDELPDDHVATGVSPTDHSDWRCVNPECPNFGDEIDPHEAGAEGPMMNYSYPLPDDLGNEMEAAAKIAHLPLCIIIDNPGREQTYSLALTGGGMDLTWEIAEAFILLGYLPPAHFAALPAMCGRGNLSNSGTYDAEVSKRDALIIAACRRTAELYAQRAKRTASSITRTLDGVEGIESPPSPREIPADVLASLDAIVDYDYATEQGDLRGRGQARGARFRALAPRARVDRQLETRERPRRTPHERQGDERP